MSPTPANPTAGWFRPTLPGRDIPAPETRRRRWSIRAIALVALAATAAYLAWRVSSTIAVDVWWISVPMFVLEVHAALGLALFTFSLWDVDRRPDVQPATSVPGRVAILIPTFNEGVEVLTPTVAAAVAMRLPHETWVLDDGERPEVARLAESLGARYIARTEHAHAKAGNVNHALGIIEADFVGILDADHVADPDFLVHTLGYFTDPGMALVQTPQDFYNLDSFEHEGPATSAGVDRTAGQRFNEQSLFYRVLQPGKNRWDAAFWCGTGAVVRVAALREVGLVATETITEDIHTTIRLHRHGWRTVYHNEVLARGLAAADAETYQLQRLRWGIGAMQVLRRENPLFVGGLTIRQRLAYAATLLGWFDAWRSLGFLLLPIVVVLTGAVPIQADPLTFGVFFGTTFVLQQLALRVLSRGCHRPILTLLFELVRMTPNLIATLTLLTNRRATFAVTPKGRTGDDRTTIRVPVPLRAAAVATVVAAAWYAATLMNATPLVYVVPWAAHAAFGWMMVNVVLVLLAVRRVQAARYSAERRSSVRFTTDLPGRLDGLTARVLDLSLTGARVELPADASIAPSPTLIVEIDGTEPIVIRSTVRSIAAFGPQSVAVGVEFAADQTPARARLALALFDAAADEASRPSSPAPLARPAFVGA